MDIKISILNTTQIVYLSDLYVLRDVALLLLTLDINGLFVTLHKCFVQLN